VPLRRALAADALAALAALAAPAAANVEAQPGTGVVA
jgi:hypothetical protein